MLAYADEWGLMGMNNLNNDIIHPHADELKKVNPHSSPFTQLALYTGRDNKILAQDFCSIYLLT